MNNVRNCIIVPTLAVVWLWSGGGGRIPRSRQTDDIIFSVFSSGFILELRYDNIMTGRGQGYSIAGIGQGGHSGQF